MIDLKLPALLSFLVLGASAQQCPEDSIQPVQGDCRLFQRCHGGALLPPEPCGAGTGFNPQTQQCDWPFNLGPECSQEVGRSLGQFGAFSQLCTTPPDGLNFSVSWNVPHPDYCNGFITCGNGNGIPACHICPLGTYFRDFDFTVCASGGPDQCTRGQYVEPWDVVRVRALEASCRAPVATVQPRFGGQGGTGGGQRPGGGGQGIFGGGQRPGGGGQGGFGGGQRPGGGGQGGFGGGQRPGGGGQGGFGGGQRPGGGGGQGGFGGGQGGQGIYGGGGSGGQGQGGFGGGQAGQGQGGFGGGQGGQGQGGYGQSGGGGGGGQGGYGGGGQSGGGQGQGTGGYGGGSSGGGGGSSWQSSGGPWYRRF